MTSSHQAIGELPPRDVTDTYCCLATIFHFGRFTSSQNSLILFVTEVLVTHKYCFKLTNIIDIFLHEMNEIGRNTSKVLRQVTFVA